MKTLFSKHKWMQLIYGLLLATAGILIIVFAINDKDNISKWLSIVVAIALFIYAAALLFSGVFSLKKKLFDIAFLYSVFCVAMGVVLLCNTEMIGKFITIFVATLLCGMGVVEIGEATAMIFFKRPVVFIVIFYILGAAFITLGVLSFSFQENVEQIIYIAVGGILILSALVEITLGTISLFKHQEIEADNNEEIVDAEVSDVPETKEEEKKEEAPVELVNNKDDSNDTSNSNPDA